MDQEQLQQLGVVWTKSEITKLIAQRWFPLIVQLTLLVSFSLLTHSF